MDDSFYDESSERSAVKRAIVTKYFHAWAGVMLGVLKQNPNQIQKLAYVDLYAGPGRYNDGTISTPIEILVKAVVNTDLRGRLVTIFNDGDEKKVEALKREIQTIPRIETLKFAPQILNQLVGDETAKIFESTKMLPTFTFIDPWGYKGLSLRLVNAVVKDWGCDCLFFFNYNRINMGITNVAVDSHLDALFGQERASALRKSLTGLSPYQRELTIVENLALSLQEMGGRYVLPFCFKTDTGNRTTHYLVFVSKHFRGYEIMKSIMAGQSSRTEEGVASFSYCVADNRQQFLSGFIKPLDELYDMLLKRYAGKTMSFKSLYEEHSIGYPYVEKNYREVLIRLEKDTKITVFDPEGKKRIAGKFPERLIITFSADS